MKEWTSLGQKLCNYALVAIVVSILCLASKSYALGNKTEAYETNAVNDNSLYEITLRQVGTPYIPAKTLNSSTPLVDDAEVIYRYKYNVIGIKRNGRPYTDSIRNRTMRYYGTNSIVGFSFSGFNSSGIGTLELDVRGRKATTFSLALTPNSYPAQEVLSAKTTIAVRSRAKYEKQFWCTGYITASESEYKGKKISAKGISGRTFKSDFLDAVKLNGSGKPENSNDYIAYNKGSYKIVSAPTTATGDKAEAGKTIAVDPYVIPRKTSKKAQVYIDGIGSRLAQDGGESIKDYRIDIYFGIGTKSMGSWGNCYKNVTLEVIK